MKSLKPFLVEVKLTAYVAAESAHRAEQTVRATLGPVDSDFEVESVDASTDEGATVTDCGQVDPKTPCDGCKKEVGPVPYSQTGKDGELMVFCSSGCREAGR